MTLVYVPAGEFQMGSENGYSDEKPVHTVYLDVFWIDQTEVTNAMYAQCVQAGDCIQPSSTIYYSNSNYNDHPVVYVSWNDASAFCEWADRRLPTEAEWEKAARGGLEGKAYPWGDEAPVCELGAENGAQYGSCSGQTVPVGSFGENGYGLYDMAGNVWEWVADWYASDYYASSPSSNPTGPDSGSSRVLRGGSWYPYGAFNIRSAIHYWDDPANTSSYLGFRCSHSSP